MLAAMSKENWPYKRDSLIFEQYYFTWPQFGPLDNLLTTVKALYQQALKTGCSVIQWKAVTVTPSET